MSYRHAVLKEVIADLEFIRCQSQEILLDADSSLGHVFFPESGVVSVVAVYADGNIIEMATIGREGCTGVQAVFGAKISSARLQGVPRPLVRQSDFRETLSNPFDILLPEGLPA